MARYRRGAHGRFAGSYGGGGGGGGGSIRKSRAPSAKGRGHGLSLTGPRPASRRQAGAIVGRSNRSGRHPARIPGQVGITRRGSIHQVSANGKVSRTKIYTQRVRLPKASAPAGSSRTNRTVIVVSKRN